MLTSIPITPVLMVRSSYEMLQDMLFSLDRYCTPQDLYLEVESCEHWANVLQRYQNPDYLISAGTIDRVITEQIQSIECRRKELNPCHHNDFIRMVQVLQNDVDLSNNKNINFQNRLSDIAINIYRDLQNGLMTAKKVIHFIQSLLILKTDLVCASGEELQKTVEKGSSLNALFRKNKTADRVISELTFPIDNHTDESIFQGLMPLAYDDIPALYRTYYTHLGFIIEQLNTVLQEYYPVYIDRIVQEQMFRDPSPNINENTPPSSKQHSLRSSCEGLPLGNHNQASQGDNSLEALFQRVMGMIDLAEIEDN